MKKSMPDVICAAVLLIFLTTVAVQVPAIPKVSRAYPIFLLAVAYLMGIWLLVKSLRRLKHEEKQETEVIAQTKIILPYCVMIALYLFLMSRIGYVVSTVVFMMVSLLYLKFKSKIGQYCHDDSDLPDVFQLPWRYPAEGSMVPFLIRQRGGL